MRLLVLVPSRLHTTSAGSRIRYGRFAANTDAFDIGVRSLEDLCPDDLQDCDVCVFSKTYSVGAIAIAHELRAKGKIVGVDLFDDYFSQTADPRLIRFRLWLSTFANVFQFALCSTSAMRALVGTYAPDLPSYLVPDPSEEIDASALAATLAAKLARARAERVLDVLWFGIGSNPFFPVGLRDLSAYAWSLADLASGSFDVRLTVLTNDDALTGANLARLGKLTVDHRFETWSVEAERRALETAMVAFLPVNGQSFSRAKSPNRAVTAIAAGTQVLSPGFPLYEGLEPIVYSDAHALLSDLDTGSCRIRPDRVDHVTSLIAEIADARAGLSELSALARTMQGRSGEDRGARDRLTSVRSVRHALVFGSEVDPHANHAAAIAGILSVKTPLTAAEGPYDVRIDHEGGRRVAVWIRPEHASLLKETFRGPCAGPVLFGEAPMIRIGAADELLLDSDPGAAFQDRRAICFETVRARNALMDIRRLCERMFPTVVFFVSETRAYLETGAGSSDAGARP